MRVLRLITSVGLASVILAGCATDEQPPAPPPPPPPPAAPPIALSPLISDAASVYVDYISDAKRINADFKNGNMIQDSLATGASYEPQQLTRGLVAYAAIVAMQDPSYRAAVRQFASNSDTRNDMAARIMGDYTYASGIGGADSAAMRVIDALSEDGKSLYDNGAAVKQAAYGLQKEAWSKSPIEGRDARMAKAKQNSVTLRSVKSGDSARLLNAAVKGEGINPASGGLEQRLYAKPYTSVVHRALTIAALSILGEGGQERDQWLSVALDDSDGPNCLGLAKLNLYQCLAVAKPHYEDVFCLGQHVLMDTGQCIGQMSSYALSFAPVKVNEAYTSKTTVPYITPTKPTKKGSTKASGARKSSAAAKKKKK